ncbi:MAG: phytanoyl-CoA dioxygenase family protein, partial [Verrucomicrobiota bacterium]
MQTLESYELTHQQIHQFHQEGWLGPFELVPPEEMRRLDARLDEQVFATDGPNPRERKQSRHMDVPLVYDLVTRPQILDRMASLYGPNLILWATFFFEKQPGGAEIPWHQDGNYWPLEPLINISAWIAIDEVTVENSCVQIIPGSHKSVVPHVKSTEGMAFGEMADPAYVETDKLVNVEMKPGEFFLFNEKTLHHSEPNRSHKRRRGLATRV